ncbi:DUF1476 domain-containing protein [Yunchengibacter salinarum]|uniref:DUF1476 domain-containing protein n=1 Tax=Yunchengibacter salinarum TaxID=3133399 RepID=UPI0035B57594
MTSFSSREKAFEDKFAHDEEMQFRARARRNRLFGQWVAESIGLGEAEARLYGERMVTEDLKEAGDEDVFRAVEADLAERKVEISRHRLEKKLEDFMREAKAQLAGE